MMLTQKKLAHCILCGNIDPDVITFEFPDDFERRVEWAEFCRVGLEKLMPIHRLCCYHFAIEHFIFEEDVLKLKDTSVPSLYDTKDSVFNTYKCKPRISTVTERRKRKRNRQKKKASDDSNSSPAISQKKTILRKIEIHDIYIPEEKLSCTVEMISIEPGLGLNESLEYSAPTDEDHEYSRINEYTNNIGENAVDERQRKSYRRLEDIDIDSLNDIRDAHLAYYKLRALTIRTRQNKAVLERKRIQLEKNIERFEKLLTDLILVPAVGTEVITEVQQV